MITYNETIIVEEASYIEWINYMKTTHIPAVMATGFFNSYKILQVIDSPNEGVTTCVQYNADNIDNYHRFYDEHHHQLQGNHHKQFENRYVLFNTLMETIEEG